MLTIFNPYDVYADSVIEFSWPSNNEYIYDGNEKKYEPVPNKDYIELSYIESTGSQYIDTEVNVNTLKSADTTISYTALEDGKIFDGVFTSASIKGSNYIQYMNSNGIVIYGNGSSKELLAKASVATNTRYRITHPITSTGNAYIYDHNGTQIGSVSIAESNIESGNLVLFNLLYDGSISSSHYTKVKCYYYKAYGLDDSLVLDLIPVITICDIDTNSDGTVDINKGTVCMYNKQNGKYYLNKGTGDFVAGPLVKTLGDGNKYGILDYLKSDGNQYIATDIHVNANTEVEFDYEVINTTTNVQGGYGTHSSSSGSIYDISFWAVSTPEETQKEDIPEEEIIEDDSNQQVDQPKEEILDDVQDEVLVEEEYQLSEEVKTLLDRMIEIIDLDLNPIANDKDDLTDLHN